MFEHWGNTIYWDSLSWEAFMTLLVGIAAVAGAVYVGRKQIKIQKAQADIQRQQTELQQLELRRLLFDLRRPVYEATREWLVFILQTGHIPNRRHDRQGDRNAPAFIAESERQATLERDFLGAVENSRFVFSPHVYAALEQFWIQGNEMQFHRVSQGPRNADRSKHIDEEHRIAMWFAEALRDLSAVFGDELKISDGGPATFRRLPSAEEIAQNQR